MLLQFPYKLKILIANLSLCLKWEIQSKDVFRYNLQYFTYNNLTVQLNYNQNSMRAHLPDKVMLKFNFICLGIWIKCT